MTFLVTTITINANTTNDRHTERQVKQVQELLKAKKSNDVLKNVEKLRADSAARWHVRLLQCGVEASKMRNNAENERLYLKAKADTTAFFATLYDTFHYIQLTDSAEIHAKNSMEHPEKYKFRFRKPNAEYCATHFTNILAAQRYFSAHAKWTETKKFTQLAIELGLSPIGTSLLGKKAAYPCESNPNFMTESQLFQLATQHVNACYRNQDFKDIEKYAAIALRDSANRERTMERLTYAEVQTGDSLQYTQRLKEGHKDYPTNMFFFSHLVGFYLHQGQNDEVLNAAQYSLDHVFSRQDKDNSSTTSTQNGTTFSHVHSPSVQTTDSITIAQFYEARAIAHHNMEKSKACINDAEAVLRWNPAHPRADYYIGANYFRMAESVEVPISVSDPSYQRATLERNRYLNAAKPHLEKYRKLNPKDVSGWAPLLYETYLYLNLGEEFEEIEQFIEE